MKMSERGFEIAAVILTIAALIGAWFIVNARYKECRKHGFSEFYCITSR